LRQNENVRSPSARLGHGGDSLSYQILANAIPHRQNGSDKIVPRDKRKRWLSRIGAPSHPLLGEGHAGSLHLNESLICIGCGYAALLNL
jgi:hypothetical protein